MSRGEISREIGGSTERRGGHGQVPGCPLGATERQDGGRLMAKDRWAEAKVNLAACAKSSLK